MTQKKHNLVSSSREVLQVVVDTERLQSDDAKRVQRVRATRDRILAAADRAVTALCEIVDDRGAKDSDRVSAARVLLQYSGVGEVTAEPTDTKTPAQMSRADLVAHLDKIRADLTGAPQPARVIDVKPV